MAIATYCRKCRKPAEHGYYCAPCRTVRYAAAFWAKVERGEGCWEWQGARKPGGYGNFYAGRYVIAHRYAYELTHGSVPADLVIDHLCSNPGCVNPAHLEAVTQRENVHRAPAGGIAAQWAARSACEKCGGALLPTIERGRVPWRTCETCGPVRHLIEGAA